MHARVCDLSRQVEEESSIPPPASCQDVPEHRRVRFCSGAIYAKIPLPRLDFLGYPYTSLLETVYSDFEHESLRIENDATTVASGNELAFIHGPTYKITQQYDEPYYNPRVQDVFFVLRRFRNDEQYQVIVDRVPYHFTTKHQSILSQLELSTLDRLLIVTSDLVSYKACCRSSPSS